MGEIIKTLSKGSVLKTDIEIELNHPTLKGKDNQIHIQSKKFRFELDEKDFLKMAFSVLVASKNLKNLKNYNE